MTLYYNPLTGSMESEEEMRARPPEQHGETVLPVGLDGLDSLKDIIPDAGDGPTPDEWIAYMRKMAADMGIKDVDRYLPSTAPDSPPPQSLPPGP